ncbi:hypothetical protein EDB84DRAFT_1459683 [Lactarius hengduanensis]|nr:hypothetical protein EDB84DRAFT_1459683 [Lactarius hengduanensis]
MQHAFRIALKGTPLLHRHFLASTRQGRYFSTPANPTSVVKKAAETKQKLPQSTSSSLDPLPSLPLPLKGTPPIINTRDIEEYIQPLYSRGWGLGPILPNGNGIPVLRKRFEFANARALQEFLADLREYEEEKHVRPPSRNNLFVLPNCISQHHAKRNIFEDQHSVLVSTWTHVARKREDPDAGDKDTQTQGVTVRDIRLAYALEELFESALAASGENYVPRLRPEADRPRTLEEYS